MDNCFLSTSVLKFDPAREDPGFGCDVVVLDLEDSVHLKAKAKAREVLSKLDLRPLVERGMRFGLRINSPSSIEGIRDLDIVHRGFESGLLVLEYLQIPKAASARDLEGYRGLFAKVAPNLRLFPIVETPEGVEAVDEIASQSDLMLFGTEDMSAAMYRPNEAYLAYARGRFCVACVREGIGAMDTRGGMNISDMVTYEEACRAGKAEGFTGRSTVHPRQIPIVKKVFAVSASELEAHRNVVSRYAAGEEGFTIHEGQVIAPPFVARAEKFLSLHGEGKRPGPSRPRR